MGLNTRVQMRIKGLLTLLVCMGDPKHYLIIAGWDIIRKRRRALRWKQAPQQKSASENGLCSKNTQHPIQF